MLNERFPGTGIPDDGRRMIRNERGEFEFKVPEPGELDAKQRSGLRETLKAMGQKLRELGPEEEELLETQPEEIVQSIQEEREADFDPSRRQFFKNVAAGAAVVIGGAAGVNMAKSRAQGRENIASLMPEEIDQVSEAAEEIKAEIEAMIDEPETIESFSEHPEFTKEVIKYQVPWELKRNEIRFVDAEGLPVGPAVELTELSDGQQVYSPGVFNEVGILKTSIDRDWLRAARLAQQAEVSERKIASHVSVAGQFAAMYRQQDEPALAQAVATGKIDALKEYIEYYADKPVVGAEHLTRLEYVQQAMKFDESVPPSAQAELRRVIPGLCAQESKFHNGLVSKSGAQGIFQFMPKTWESYGGSQKDFLSLTRQVEIAGEFISDLYKRLPKHIGEDVMSMLRARFDSEEAFERDLFIPLVINSYNAGDSCIAEGVRQYMEGKRVEDLPAGKDLFLAIAEFSKQAERGQFISKYGTEAREYVPRIYAQAEVLQA